MDLPQASSSTASTSTPVNLGVRKRVDSNPNESSDWRDSFIAFKKQRTSLLFDIQHDISFASTPSRASSSFSVPNSPSTYVRKRDYEDRFIKRPSWAKPFDWDSIPLPGSPRALEGSLSMSASSVNLGPHSLFSSPHREPSLSRSSSFTGFSRSASPAFMHPFYTPPIPEASAQKWLKNTRITFDYAPPTTSTTVSTRLLTCSEENILYFTRGDRVHHKNLSSAATDDVGQLCKVKASEHGHVRALAFSVRNQGETLAVGTSKGHIQLWDVQTKKMKSTWKALQTVSAMVWNGPILTVGSVKGSIRTYDSRIPANRVKEQCKMLIRHEAEITSLAWNREKEGNYLASGDASGTVLCWADKNWSVPMDIGEPVKRRKKMVHAAKISAITWCPWKTSEFVTGDVDGVVRLWDIHKSFTNVRDPGTIETRAAITTMHFSRRSSCPELLMTHGVATTSEPISSSPSRYERPRERVDNAISVVEYPTFKSRGIFRLNTNPEKAISDSVLDRYGTKLIYATPADKKLNVADIWMKKEIKEPRRQQSLLTIGLRQL